LLLLPGIHRRSREYTWNKRDRIHRGSPPLPYTPLDPDFQAARYLCDKYTATSPLFNPLCKHYVETETTRVLPRIINRDPPLQVCQDLLLCDPATNKEESNTVAI
jgi:hypothetical protein